MADALPEAIISLYAIDKNGRERPGLSIAVVKTTPAIIPLKRKKLFAARLAKSDSRKDGGNEVQFLPAADQSTGMDPELQLLYSIDKKCEARATQFTTGLTNGSAN